MKPIFNYTLAALCALPIVGCDDDGSDQVLTASLVADTTIATQDTNIVLDVDNTSALALTVYWDDLGKVTYGTTGVLTTTDDLVNTIQLSISSSFTDYYEQTLDNDASFVQFTVGSLNDILTGLGASEGATVTLYIRQTAALGTDAGSSYSNTISTKVTTYAVDLSSITMRGVSSGSYSGTDIDIPSTGTSGSYAGFAHIANSWWNCFFVEGDGTIWGSIENKGPFNIETKSDISSWNVWFPEATGCYYVEISTSGGSWSCQNLSKMSLTAGSASAVTMTYDKSFPAYYYVLTTTEDNTAIEVSYSATLYNSSTGDSSGRSVTYPLVASSDGTFAVGSSGTSTGITASSAGEYTLIFYLSDLTWTLSSGSVSPSLTGSASGSTRTSSTPSTGSASGSTREVSPTGSASGSPLSANNFDTIK